MVTHINYGGEKETYSEFEKKYSLMNHNDVNIIRFNMLISI